jgi:membrane protease YdiL (CAAX protease family)
MQASEQPWGFWATLAWTALALGLAVAVALPAANWAATGLFPTHPGRFVRDDIALIVGVVIAVAVLAFAVRRAGWSPAAYFALTRPSTRHLVIGIAVVAIAQAAFFSLLFLVGKGIPTPAESRLDRAAGALAVLLPLFTAIIVSPISEEVIFRGFLYRGLAASRLGIGGAITLTALAWTAAHYDRSWNYLIASLAFGLILGWCRWRTGTTTLPIVLHAQWNFLFAALGILAEVGWMK